MSTIKQAKLDELWRLSAIQAGRKIDLPENPGDKEEYIQLLTEFMETSADQCQFLEAESAKQKIDQLKGNLNSQKKTELIDKHHTEQDDIDRAHSEEINQFNIFWNEKESEFGDESEQMMKEMEERQKEEHIQYREELENGLPQKSKDSNRLLDMKGQRETLSRQKAYIDAHLVHVQIEKMEQQEQEAFEAERKQKVQTQLNHLSVKHQQEVQALEAKIRKGQEEQGINRKHEEDKLVLKYKVVKKDIGNRQCTEQNILKKTQKNPGMNNSRQFSQSRMSQSRSRIV